MSQLDDLRTTVRTVSLGNGGQTAEYGCPAGTAAVVDGCRGDRSSETNTLITSNGVSEYHECKTWQADTNVIVNGSNYNQIP